MTELSPAAQAVVDALYMEELNGPQQLLALFHAAAALEAVADQVVPEQRKPSSDSDYHLMNWSKSLDQYYQRQQTRAELLAIADELE